MNFLEKDLEQIIFETPNTLLNERGYRICGKKHRQLKIGNYGIADIVTATRALCPATFVHNLVIEIHEFKKDEINLNTFMQAIKYCKGISHYLELREFYMPYQIRISLCGKSIDDCSEFIYLPDLISGDSDFDFDGKIVSVSLYTYSYDFNGISFREHSNYGLIEHGFATKQRNEIPEDFLNF